MVASIAVTIEFSEPAAFERAQAILNRVPLPGDARVTAVTVAYEGTSWDATDDGNVIVASDSDAVTLVPSATGRVINAHRLLLQLACNDDFVLSAQPDLRDT